MGVTARKPSWHTTQLQIYKDQLNESLSTKRIKIKRLKRSIEEESDDIIKPLTEGTDNRSKDEYGSTFSNLIQIRTQLERIKIKKLFQLLCIFQNTQLFSSDDEMVTLDKTKLTPTSIYEGITLSVIKKSTLQKLELGTEDDYTFFNARLGYYLLFIYVIANKIYKISLPHSLHYCGSTSIINYERPLHLVNSKNRKILKETEDAIDYFNKDILQTIQYLEHHYLI